MYAMERKVNQTIWAYLMKDVDEGARFENDTYIIKPYDWSDNDDNAWHFYHKPSGLKVQWYKYPLRSPYSNIKITNEQWWDVLADCYNSTSDLIKYDYDAWWEGDEHISPNGTIDDKLIRATLSEYAPIEVLADYVLDSEVETKMVYMTEKQIEFIDAYNSWALEHMGMIRGDNNGND